jgi:hypothetical protein
MKEKRNKRPSREMNPVFLVLCEGETEEAYINFLRREKYHQPIKLIPRVIGSKISPKIIKNYIQAEQIGQNDKMKSFLMYDLDNKDIVVKLALCKDSIRITNNPSVEVWFLLHIEEQKAHILTDACIQKLMNVITIRQTVHILEIDLSVPA